MTDDLTARARLRNVTIALIADGDKPTARSVASKAGVSIGLIRHHFGTMDGLLLACDEHIATLIRDAKNDAIRGPLPNVLETLREAGQDNILSYLAHRLTESTPGIDYMDREGRVLRADFETLSVMSLYLPSGTNPDRLDFKLTFMADFQKYIDKLKQKVPNLVICGDYNICHEAIDIHDPIRNANVSGFLPVEREWLDKFMKSGFIDSFRYFHKEAHQYSWWSYRANARNNNKGWRIDYHLVSAPLEKRMERALILPEAKHSDHCPILLMISD